MNRLGTQFSWVLAVAVLVVAISGPAFAAVRPERTPAVAELELRHRGLTIETVLEMPDSLAADDARAAISDLSALGLEPAQARIDRRSGRWAMLMPAEPLIPGDGKGNFLSWAAAPGSEGELRARTWEAFGAYLQGNANSLRIDPDELARPGRLTIHNDGDLIQIWIPRVIEGVPVRDNYLSAVISHGNLILFGAHSWGDLNRPAQAPVSESEAVRSVAEHVAAVGMTGTWRQATLTYLPMAIGSALQPEIGNGLDYRLVWVVRPTLGGDQGNWEGLVDAVSGELLAFQDTNHYAAAEGAEAGVATPRRVQGGVYPVSNDGTPPDGVEQAGWPMPFDLVITPAGVVTTDSGGNLPDRVDGAINSKLSGEFIHMDDDCGSISLTSGGDIDFGTSGGDDCVTPGFGGAGNTHSSRTGFHELNRIAELARSQLPANSWLTQTLTANMNINNNCNAFWNGSVNFYRSGGGCGNTGELAGVFDHEWGHGMDSNDAVPGISSPGEGIPDIYAGLRLDTSCIGRAFFSNNCSGYGDPCIDCTGIRDIDWAMRQSGNPHDYSWSNSNCGGISHCQGAVYAESVWDIYTRDLPSEYGMDKNTAHEVTQRLTYLGAGNVGTWFSGGPPFGGCGAGGGYLNYLAADDDNGDISDGTPHMRAIFRAFNRHEIACATPAVQDSGCVGTPVGAPVVSGGPLPRSSFLNWDAVADATGYQIFRGEGVSGCDVGKIKVGSTAGTSFLDENLQNGRDYYYTVIPMGQGDACFGPASSCTTVVPAEGPNVSIDTNSAEINLDTGDGDDFIDNCEMGSMSLDVSNTGIGVLTNVRITGVSSPSHPGMSFDSVFPVQVVPPTLAEGETGLGTFEFTAGGLSFDDTVTFLIEFTADQVGIDKADEVAVPTTESDFGILAELTYDFESDDGGWQIIDGTFDRTNAGGGANGTSWYEASSAFVSEQCDQLRSPIVMLTATSTLSLYNQFDIEVFNDRANIGIYDVLAGTRSPVEPDGGRLYNSGNGNSTCGLTGQKGWGNATAAWGESTWSAGALGAGDLAGRTIQLDVLYATDGLIEGFGFQFDEVTLTDVSVQSPDAQSDVCEGGGFVLSDPEPGVAGVMNDLAVAGASPNGVVAYAFGTAPGSFSLGCGGEIGIDAPLNGGQTTVDGSGNATLTRMIPGSAGGKTVFMQAIDQLTCSVSNVVKYTFP